MKPRKIGIGSGEARRLDAPSHDAERPKKTPKQLQDA
jgi:hypothetical protein